MARAYLLALVVCITSVTSAVAQPPAPKPGPEHEVLAKMAGTWDAAVKAGPMEGKGVMKYKMDLGGLWLVSSFEGEFSGQKFSGKGLDGYDPQKAKYVGIWVDSMSSAPMISEGTYDKDKKTFTSTGEGPGQDGKPTKLRTVSEFKDDDNMIMTMYGPDNQVMMTITYTRKK